MARLWPVSPIPPLGPPAQRWAIPGHMAGTEEHYAISKVRRHPAYLAGAPFRNKGTLKVTNPGQGCQEDLTVTGSSDRGQFPGAQSRREMYRQAKERTP